MGEEHTQDDGNSENQEYRHEDILERNDQLRDSQFSYLSCILEVEVTPEPKVEGGDDRGSYC